MFYINLYLVSFISHKVSTDFEVSVDAFFTLACILFLTCLVLMPFPAVLVELAWGSYNISIFLEEHKLKLEMFNFTFYVFGICASICTHREIQCILYAGF